MPGDRLAELKARYPKQVFTFDRNNITYFEMNHRKPPFDKLAVRQALNYAVDRTALVKIFGGQGIPTENIVPPGLGAAYEPHHFYPYDLAKAKALVQSSGDAGMAVTVWSHSTDPAPKAAAVHGGRARLARLQGERQDARRVGLLGHHLDAEGRSRRSRSCSSTRTTPRRRTSSTCSSTASTSSNVGNQVHSNVDIPALDKRIDAARAMPLGPARDAAWASLDAAFMKQDAPWVPFMYRQLPKYVSARLHNLVFNGTYYEMFPSMELTS